MHSRRLDSCVVAFLTVGVVLASCTTGERDGDLRTPYTVAGTITDADTGGPLPDITIVFLGEGAPGSVTTGADGRYEQTGFFPGTLIVAPAGNYDFLYRDPVSGKSLVAPVEIDITEAAPNNTVQVDFTAVTSGTSLDLLDPNGGEQLPAGSVAQIEWTVTNLSGKTVTLEYWDDGPQQWVQIESGVACVDGANIYVWTLPDADLSSCQVRVTCVERPAFTDQSDAGFTVYQVATLRGRSEVGLAPLPGVVYRFEAKAGSGSPEPPMSIMEDVVPGVAEGGDASTLIDADRAGEPDGTYVNATVKVLSGLNQGEVRTVTGFDGATGTLTVDSPLPEAFEPPVEYEITGSGRFELSGFLPGTYVVTPSKTGFTFTPPSQEIVIAGSGVRDLADVFAADSSGATLELLRPSDGETLVVNTPFTVRWAESGLAGSQLTIEVNYGLGYVVETSAADAGLRQYSWTPTQGSALARVRLTSNMLPVLSRESGPAGFEIVWHQTISGVITMGDMAVTLVTGANVFFAGTEALPGVQTGPLGDYSRDRAEPDTYTVTPVKAGLEFEPPSQPVVVTAGGDVTGVDFLAFPMGALVTVNSPSGGEMLVAGSTEQISVRTPGLAGGGYTLRVEYSDGGAGYILIADVPISASTTTYDWLVPVLATMPNASMLVRASVNGFDSVLYPRFADVSDATFTVAEAEVTISASVPAAAEPATDGEFTLARTGGLGAGLTVSLSVSGTATEGGDYAAIGLSVVIPAGQPSVAVPVQVIDDLDAEDDETVTVTLAAGAGYAVGSPSAATVTIADDEPTVTIVATDPAASETGPDVGEFTVTRAGDTTNSLTVAIVIAGTATEGTDYALIGSAVTIPATQASVIVTVTPVADADIEGAESVVMALVSSVGYAVGVPDMGTVAISDDVDVTPPTVVFTTPADLDTGVAWDATVTVNFDEFMDAASVEAAFSTVPPTTGTSSWPAGDQLVFTPDADLTFQTSYTVTVDGATAMDLWGNLLGPDYVFTFTTEGQFVDFGQALGASDTLAVALGDVDGDGDLDLVAGNYNNQINHLYLNNGTVDPFNGVTGSDIDAADAHNTWSVTLGDVDGDGDLDLVAGNWGQTNRLYLNNGTADPFGGVTGSDVAADAHQTKSVAVGDLDGDGDLDLVAGNDSHTNRLYLNNGTADPFGGVTGSEITLDEQNVWSVALGDVDGDGDLDLVAGNLGQTNRLYLNNGTADPFAGVTGSDVTPDAHSTWSVALGDADGDGDLDLVAGNYNETNRLYLNNGTADPFGGVTGSDVTAGARYTRSVALGDVDGDGDLDLVAGNDGQANRVYRNNSAVANTAPSPPGGLSTGVAGSDVTFSWNAATDAETPQPGLTYNLRVGTAPGAGDVFSGHAYGTGLRQIPALGNASLNLSWTLKGLPVGSYYWSVQAIDASWDGSPWAGEKSFNVGSTVTITATDAVASEAGPDTGEFTVTRAGSLAGDLTVSIVVSGAAEMNVDYTLTGSLPIPDGQASTTLTVTPVADSAIEGDEWVMLALVAGPGYDVGTPDVATVTIVDDPTGGLRLWYKFDETVGTTAVDSSGNGKDGTLTNMDPATDWGAGVLGGGLDFDGTDDYVISFNNITIWGDGARTVAFWANAAGATDGGVVGWGPAGGGDQQFCASVVAGNWWLVSSGPGDWDTGMPVQIGLWQHHAVTYDGATLRWYVDGVEVGSYGYAYWSNDGNVYVGQGDMLGNFNGLLDDVRIYNRVLSAADIQALYDAGAVTLPVVTVTAPDPNATEAGDMGEFALARTGDTSGPLTVDFLLVGTATEGTDYTAIGTSVTIPPAAASTVVLVQPISDVVTEGDETVQIVVLSGAGYDAGSPNNATVTIVELPVVTITASDPTAAEPADVGELQVDRAGPTAGSLPVNYTVSGTATDGVDYTVLSGVVTIPDAATTAWIPISPVDDALIEADETVIVTLMPDAAYVVGTPSSATVTIASDDVPIVQWSAGSQTVGEAVGNVTVIAVLSAAGVADVTVPYTVSGTAASPADHDLVGGSIVILAGNLNGSVSFNVVSDTMDENNETVVLTMGAPTNAVPGATTVHTATITDDDVAPVVNWSGPSQTVGEAVGPVTVTATLSTVSGLDVTVPYAVSGTAANPEDHDLANGSVVILAGNLNGSVAFNVVNDVMSEVDETVIVTMGAPTNATLGATTVHTVTITDDDAGPGMVLHYEFDDVADGTAVDTSGNANDGAVTPPDTRPAGRIGQALDLDGSTTKVTSANPMGITGSAARTVVFWANPTTAPQCAVVGWGAQIIDQLFMTSINNGSWYLQARGGSGDWDTGIAVQTGVWTHHAITYDGTTVKWYVDSGAPVSSPAHVYATADGVLQIGKHPDLPPYYDGLLDDVRVYDIALTPAEIDGLYQAVVTRWYVDSTAGSGGDGTSWATAFEYVQDGLAAAVAGHEIWVAAGTYTNNAGGTATVLVMVDGVSIYGGFAGTEDLRSERDPVANVTTLDGENTAYHVVEGASNATLDGFTVTRGNASGASPDDKGAGLYCFGQSDLAVAGCRFTSCTGSGTIVHFENCSSVSCSTSSVDNNSVAARTMYIRLSDLVVIDSCRFFNNSINYSSALDVGDCSPVVRNCVFWGNTSPGTSGNGIYATGAISVPLLSNCVFAYNNNYGVLAAYGATVTLRNCIVWGNTSGSIYTFSGGELGFVDATYCDIAGGYVGGNIDADPLFVDPDGPDAIPGTADDDFRLSAGSPCIDAADGDAAPAADLDGNPRSDDTGTPDTGVGAITYADMGAYEFQGTTPPPVAPYTPDANTVLLDHFDGTIDPSGTIEAFSYTGVSNPEPPAVPNYAWVAGPNGLGQALELLPPIAEPAGSATYLRYPGELLSTANGTIEFWLYATTWGLSLVDQGPNFGSGSGWTYGMSVEATGSLAASAWASFSLNSGAVKVPLNKWTHVAATWGAAGAKLYIDGVEVGSDPITTGPGSGFGGNVLIRAGSSQSGGIIDELRISNVQRTVFNLP